ncbi:MAG: phosphoribosylaminoimidazolesuccinocarboxamide synthase [Armatimonadetes bacterium]|nr:phosphoribosylaminoimidazolesuccinocarboxamide synthase [Armatimonadota bacterium]MDE2205118.1 phosphoribosylaminoimidazolesuccinocarboxamide synthase [Armatimonadota bacterium]
MQEAILHTRIPGLAAPRSGKVRDCYDLGGLLLLVATDRISAYDVIMPNGIPGKGKVLTQLSAFWFGKLPSDVPTHLVSADDESILDALMSEGLRIDETLAALLKGRTTLALKATPIPIECVARGYLAGSLWQEYRDAGGEQHEVNLHGTPLPAGLTESSRLAHPIFTPATKAESGHDINIGMEEVAAITSPSLAERLRATTLQLYATAAARALERGIIIADTKFEFGWHSGELRLIDEALTPDSSRFWDAAAYEPGRSQASFDKQFVRDWLIESGWNRTPPAPMLPPEVVQGTVNRYCEAFRRITGAEPAL